jgi:hypothetical protein
VFGVVLLVGVLLVGATARAGEEVGEEATEEG